jgi:hypothetical protein
VNKLLRFTEADEFRLKVQYSHNSWADDAEEWETPMHQITTGGCDCCTTSRNAETMTAEEIEELAEQAQNALAFLNRLKIARFNLSLRIYADD